MNIRHVSTVILGSFVALACWGAWWRSSNPAPATRDLSGGARVQRERIDRFIDATGKLDVNQAVESLSEYNESYELVQFAGLSPSSLWICYIKQIAAERRVSKCLEYLQKLPEQEASNEASRIFDDKFTIFQNEWQRFSLELGGENTGPKHHAASVGLFLCSYFCSPHILDQKLNRWEDIMHSGSFDRIEGVDLLACNRFVDPLFRLNLLVISGWRNGASVEKLNQVLDVLTRKISGDSKPFLQVDTLRVFKWNAETLDTDFTHLTRGVPASGNSILLELPGFNDANTFPFLQDKEVFAHLEETIDKWRQNGGN